MFEQLAAENGYEKLSMICADSNPAIYLYERLGYQKEKMLSTWYTTRDKKGIFMNKRTNSKENDTISKKTGNKARQLSIYFFASDLIDRLTFLCVWLLTREKNIEKSM